MLGELFVTGVLEVVLFPTASAVPAGSEPSLPTVGVGRSDDSDRSDVAAASLPAEAEPNSWPPGSNVVAAFVSSSTSSSTLPPLPSESLEVVTPIAGSSRSLSESSSANARAGPLFDPGLASLDVVVTASVDGQRTKPVAKMATSTRPSAAPTRVRVDRKETRESILR